MLKEYRILMGVFILGAACLTFGLVVTVDVMAVRPEATPSRIAPLLQAGIGIGLTLILGPLAGIMTSLLRRVAALEQDLRNLHAEQETTVS